MSENRVSRIRAGSESDLAEACDEYRPRLRRTVGFRLDPRLQGRVDPEDVLQEAYLAAANRHAHVEGEDEAALFIWLRMIVVQTLAEVHRRHFGVQKRDAARDARQRAAAATSMSLAARLVGTMTSPSNAMGREEQANRVHTAIDELAPMDQEILALRHFEELSNQEVAAVLDIEQKAASVRYIRALKRLKELLAPFSMSELR